MSIENKLFQEQKAARVLLENYKDVIGDDDEVRADVVEGETDLFETFELIASEIADEQAYIEAIGDQIRRLESRKHRKAEKVQRLKTAASSALEMAGKKKLETAIATLTVKALPAQLIIKNEAEIPASYWRPKDPALDRMALKKALKEKQQIPGAELSNGGQTLQIKWS